VTTWRTARSETPLGVVGVAAVVAADPSPPLSNTYAPPRAGFTMVSRTSSMFPAPLDTCHFFLTYCVKGSLMKYFSPHLMYLVCLGEASKMFGQ